VNRIRFVSLSTASASIPRSSGVFSHTLWSKIQARLLFLVTAFAVGGVVGTGTVCAAGPVACRFASGCAASSGAERLVLAAAALVALAAGAADASAPPGGFGPGGFTMPAEGSTPGAAAADAPLAAALAAGAADLTLSPTSVGPPTGTPMCSSALLASQSTAVAFFSSAASARLAGSKRRTVRALCQPPAVRKMWSSLS
jgi:hypothetical protein